MRMIDEKGLVNEIKNWIKTDRFEDYFAGYILSDVIEEINKMPKVGEWIPCSERKPRELIDVLVTVQDIQNGDDMLVMIGNYKDWWQVYDIDGTEQSKARVFAWQPLPEPYREESAE